MLPATGSIATEVATSVTKMALKMPMVRPVSAELRVGQVTLG
jgi:hypothetical protein